jgi:hypothetical protein
LHLTAEAPTWSTHLIASDGYPFFGAPTLVSTLTSVTHDEHVVTDSMVTLDVAAMLNERDGQHPWPGVGPPLRSDRIIESVRDAEGADRRVVVAARPEAPIHSTADQVSNTQFYAVCWRSCDSLLSRTSAHRGMDWCDSGQQSGERLYDTRADSPLLRRQLS